MKKSISILLLAVLLSGCSYLRVHKVDVDQGNIISPSDVSQLHVGISESQVKDVMGTPALTNLFTDDRLEYVYTFKKGYGKMQETRVTCIFRSGRLTNIMRS
ncbi:MAG: outer membrane protein assembly factor BamE [Gammaproteobacteria bacterium]|nr:outer membrane protein assembly factor BamE [Gammaproteobacteria bacterium]